MIDQSIGIMSGGSKHMFCAGPGYSVGQSTSVNVWPIFQFEKPLTLNENLYYARADLPLSIRTINIKLSLPFQKECSWRGFLALISLRLGRGIRLTCLCRNLRIWDRHINIQRRIGRNFENNSTWFNIECWSSNESRRLESNQNCINLSSNQKRNEPTKFGTFTWTFNFPEASSFVQDHSRGDEVSRISGSVFDSVGLDGLRIPRSPGRGVSDGVISWIKGFLAVPLETLTNSSTGVDFSFPVEVEATIWAGIWTIRGTSWPFDAIFGVPILLDNDRPYWASMRCKASSRTRLRPWVGWKYSNH